MHPARIVHLFGHHPGAIRRDDPAKFRHRLDQARDTDPAASGTPVARDVQDGSARADLAEGDKARWHILLAIRRPI
jgi:hypothetical protein